MRISAASTISHQDTFQHKGFSAALTGLKQGAQVLEPDYTKFIAPMELRRMSEVLKMAIVCAVDCLDQAELEQPDAIVVGTAIGCAVHTKNFMDKILASDGGLISPTSFILSTHNTIAGQISLRLKNHGYNMTHTQNSLSFEQALMDAMLCVKGGCKQVLAGAADELETSLYDIKARLHQEHAIPVCGASFFVLSAEAVVGSDINLVDVESLGLVTGLTEHIATFLSSNKLSAADIDLLLYSNSTQNTVDELTTIFGNGKLYDYQAISGTYLTNSAFALHFGIDALSYTSHPLFGENVRNVLICNNLIPENLGLILLNKTY